MPGALRRARPAALSTGYEAATATTLRHLAHRRQVLAAEIDESTNQLRTLVQAAAPALLATNGIGVVTAAQLIITAGDNADRFISEGPSLPSTEPALCRPLPARPPATALIAGGPASQRRTTPNRPDQHEQRPRIKAYIQKRTSEGKSTREPPDASNEPSPRGLPNPDKSTHDRTNRGRAPRRLTHGLTLQAAATHPRSPTSPDLRIRTRKAPRRSPHQRMPSMAQRRLTRL